MVNNRQFRFGVLLVFSSFLALHILAFLLFIFSASFKNILANHSLSKYYGAYAFSGPYFSENTYIQATNKFYYRFKDSHSGWSEFRNVEEEHFQAYHKNYLSLHSLKTSRLEKSLAEKLYYGFYNSDSTELSHLKTMQDYLILNDLFNGMVPDSIVILYTKSNPIYYSPRRIEIDTLTYFKYSPLELE